MNKRIRTGLISATILGGSIFGVTQVAGTVNAQTDDTAPATEQVADNPLDAPSGSPADEVAPDGECGPRGEHGPRGDRGARAEETAALIGIDVEDLRTALESGQTLAEVAEANGVDAQTIIDAKVADRAEHLATAVEEGRLTEAEAAERLADATEKITTMVNEGPSDEGRPERPGRPDVAGAAVDA